MSEFFAIVVTCPTDSNEGKLTDSRLIRMKELASTRKSAGLLPMCPATIWAMVKSGKFPAPIKFSERITAWRMSDVMEFIQNASEQQGTPTHDQASKKTKKGSKPSSLLQGVKA